MKKYIFLTLLISIQGFAANFMVITHESNVQSSITNEELKQILLANTTNWKDGKKIFIATFVPGTSEGEEIFKKYMSMSGIQAKKHYLTKVFSGVLFSAPTMVDSMDDIIDYVAKKPGAIAVIPETAKPAKVKILTVN